MRIREILAEVRAGKVPKRFQKSSTGLHIFNDAEKANTDYTHYRLGLALAMSNGKEDRKSTRLNSSHVSESRMPSSA